MQQYLELIEYVLREGTFRTNRTDTPGMGVFGYQMRFNLAKEFPLLTTKTVNWNAIVHELLWFIKGDTNIKYLVDNGVNIWNDWPYVEFTKREEFQGETFHEFVEKIKTDADFAAKYGNLGPVYGKQWRNFNGVDQLAWVIEEIKKNPDSRRLIVSAWNPSEVGDMLLPPCHTMFQFYVQDGKLSCQLYQRSADIFLGLPFNMASYALLTHLMAKEAGLQVGEFVHTLGDAHIYINHMEALEVQIGRELRRPPRIKLKSDKSIFEYTIDDIELVDYNPYPPIKGKVAV